MSRVAIICVLVVFVGLGLADEKYTDKFDNVDLQAILINDRLRSNYGECLLADDESKCTAEGKALKKILAEALATDCAKCTDKQKIGFEKAIRYLFKNYREFLEKLEKKFNPSGSFLEKHPEYKE